MALVAPIAPASAFVQARRRSLTPPRQEECQFEYASSSVVASFPQHSIAPSRFYSVQSTPRTPATVAEAAADVALRAAQAAVAAAHAASIAADECTSRDSSNNARYGAEISPADSPGFFGKRFLPVEDAQSVSGSRCATARSSLDAPAFRVVSEMRDAPENCVAKVTNPEGSTGGLPVCQRATTTSVLMAKFQGRKPLSRTTSAMPATGSEVYQVTRKVRESGGRFVGVSAARDQERCASVGHVCANLPPGSDISSPTRLSSRCSYSSVERDSIVALAVTPAESLPGGSTCTPLFSGFSDQKPSQGTGVPLLVVSRQQEDDDASSAFRRLGIVRQVTGESSRMTSRMSVFMEDAAAVAMSLAEDGSLHATPQSREENDDSSQKTPAQTRPEPPRCLVRHASMPAFMPADEQRQKVLKDGIPPTLTPQDLLKLQREAKKNFNSQTFLSGATLKSLLMAPDEKGSTLLVKAPEPKAEQSFACRALEAAREAAAASPGGNFARTLSLPEETVPRMSFIVMDDEEQEERETKGRRRRRVLILEDEDELDIIAAADYYKRDGFSTSCRNIGDRCRSFLQKMVRLCW
ncbi:conserved hypothetical protein [Neospora caninum Liverpool]|uniref:Uncharacterized protein n=1 Tax=Neospora caninum (strain Liverpool) TaxID=572307 RepID=F0V8M2_NEOCL|nr:conserved hypothetical protein [Neospora caninum Liverpool]CBZ50063.1 conserved hypothetical protein [Neospora caninum Liverpool]CEL64657.1 TPA: hypothetical protein BN1204_005390 [Neospora caninum Liverpool]|eukprot:XP_003880098.1 conserved hypothetical protein [Neospora caninum Liverpool]